MFWERRAADAFLADPSFWKPARRCLLRPEFGAVLTDTIIVSSQGICGSDLIDHRQREAAAEASHKMRCAFGQQSGGGFFSVEVCGFSCCLTVPSGMVRRRLHKNKNNKDSTSKHFEKFAAEVAQ